MGSSAPPTPRTMSRRLADAYVSTTRGRGRWSAGVERAVGACAPRSSCERKAWAQAWEGEELAKKQNLVMRLSGDGHAWEKGRRPCPRNVPVCLAMGWGDGRGEQGLVVPDMGNNDGFRGEGGR
eukprot:scaffold6388_cov103-Isochrysis_galbana.AAC.3